jgi:hypothetical protein
MGVTTETSGDTWIITNGGTGSEDIYIKADGTTWSPGATSGVDQFVLKHEVSGVWGDPITNVDNGILLKAGLAVAGTQTFDLQFTAPTSTTESGEHILTVTLTAATHLFTWSGSAHTVADCEAIGGIYYDTGATGTICRYPGATVPTGWTQAENYQRYSGTWGGDVCDRHKSVGPSTFSNQICTVKERGTTRIWGSRYCGSATSPNYWLATDYADDAWNVAITYQNPSTNRVEIGIY